MRKLGWKMMVLALMGAMVIGIFSGCGNKEENDRTVADAPESTVQEADEEAQETIEAEPMDDIYEFVFTGSGEDRDGNKFTITLLGKEDGSVEAQSEEIPTLLLEGNWEFVENKGYKITLDDGWNYPVICPSYNTQTSEFSFNFNLSMVDYTFTYKDEEFADHYDGVGLEELPTFACTGWCHDNTLLPATLRLYEDGTCRVQSDFSVPIMDMGRKGTWSYNEETNTYVFDFEQDQWEHALTYEEDGVVSYRHYLGPNDEYEHWPVADGPKEFTSHVESVYDEATQTYTIEFSAICCSVVDWTGTYTTE